MNLMNLRALLAIGVSICLAGRVQAKEQADALSPANADQLLLVRAGVRSVVSIQSAYQGDLGKFVFIIPTPVPVKREDLHQAPRLFDKLDQKTRPYLVATPLTLECMSGIDFDGETGVVPMSTITLERSCGEGGRAEDIDASKDPSGDIFLDYDFKIWRAEQAKAMLPWLRLHRFAASASTRAAIAANIRHGMSFIVASVNMGQAKKEGWTRPPPLQFAFDSDAFLLPFNLAALDSGHRQVHDMLVYFLTLQGMVDSKNYPATAVSKERELTGGVQGRFGEFYDCMLDGTAGSSHGMETVIEYFSTPRFLLSSEVQRAGAQWLSAEALKSMAVSQAVPRTNYYGERQPFFLTRLRVRYPSQNVPIDMDFVELPGKPEVGGMMFRELQKPLKTLEECKKPTAELDCNSTCDAIMSNAENKIYPKFPRSHEACVSSCLDVKEFANRNADAMATRESARFEAAEANTRAMCPAWNAAGKSGQGR